MKTHTKKRVPPRSFRCDEETYKQLQQLRRFFGGVSESEAIIRAIAATATGKTPIIVRPLYADLKGVREALAATEKFGAELKEARHAPWIDEIPADKKREKLAKAEAHLEVLISEFETHADRLRTLLRSVTAIDKLDLALAKRGVLLLRAEKKRLYAKIHKPESGTRATAQDWDDLAAIAEVLHFLALVGIGEQQDLHPETD